MRRLCVVLFSLGALPVLNGTVLAETSSSSPPTVALQQDIAPAASGVTKAPRAPSFATTGPEWTMPGQNTALTRFSELAEITRENVAQLKATVTFSTGLDKGHEAAPLMVGNTLYVVTPYPNILYALDLTKPGAPLKWKFEPAQVEQGATREN